MGYRWKKIGHEQTITEVDDGYMVAHYTVLYTFMYLKFFMIKIFKTQYLIHFTADAVRTVMSIEKLMLENYSLSNEIYSVEV